jgi:hypothetical protein
MAASLLAGVAADIPYTVGVCWASVLGPAGRGEETTVPTDAIASMLITSVRDLASHSPVLHQCP